MQVRTGFFYIGRDTYTYWSLRLYWKAAAAMSLSLPEVTVLERAGRTVNASVRHKLETP